MAGRLIVVQVVLPGRQLLLYVRPVRRRIGSPFRLVGGILCFVGLLARLLGGLLHPVGAFLRQPLLVVVGPLLRQLSSLLGQPSALLGPDGCFFCLLGQLPSLLGSFPQLVRLSLRPEAGAQRLDLRRRDSRLLGLADIPLLRSLPRAWIAWPGLGRLPGHAVRLTRLRHALARGSLLGLVTGHGHVFPASLPAPARLGA